MTDSRHLSDAPDAPGRVPLLGHLVALLQDLPSVMQGVASSPEPLHRLRLPFGTDMHIWSSPEALELLADDQMSAVETAHIGQVVVGYASMLSSDGATHRRLRTASQVPFTPRGLTMTGVSDIIAEVITARVRAMLSRRRVRVLDETQAISLEILFRILGVPRDELDEWVAKYDLLIRGIVGPAWDVPGVPYHRALRARTWVDARLAIYVDAARRDPDAVGLVAELVRGRDERGAGLDDIELLDNLRLLVLAGHETTASVMAWMVAYLADSPELMERLITESRGDGELPRTAKALRAYPLAAALFREALRLHPPVTIIPRTTRTHRQVAGFAVPEGTVIGIPVWLFARDPETFEDPHRFDPARWIRRSRRPGKVELSMFGSGSHFCLGYHMALVEGVQFAVALGRALDEEGLRPIMRRLPGETYLPLLRPRADDTRCRFVEC